MDGWTHRRDSQNSDVEIPKIMEFFMPHEKLVSFAINYCLGEKNKSKVLGKPNILFLRNYWKFRNK